MHTPWFLGHLDLSIEADAAAIRRAYARLLKKIDQATDIDAFMRLHEAYRLAMEWSRHRSTEATPAAPPADTGDTPGRMDAGPESAALPRNGTHRATARHIDPSEDIAEPPRATATRAIEALKVSLATGAPAQQALDEQLRAVRDGHLLAISTFEVMLLDGLMRSLLPKRLALFHAAREAFAWSDITHLSQLGHAGPWLDQLGMELRAWQKECFTHAVGTPIDQLEGTALLERADVSAQDFNRAAALNWPVMRDLLARYPRYIALRYDRAALLAWDEAYKAIAPTDTHAGSAREPQRENPGRLWSKPLAPAFFCLGVLLLIALLYVAASLGRHPVSPTLADDAETEAHRQRAAIPELPRNPPIDQRTCSYVEHAVHAEGWNPPDDPEMRDRIRATTRSCLNLGLWPNQHAYDPQLQKLGIFEAYGSFQR